MRPNQALTNHTKSIQSWLQQRAAGLWRDPPRYLVPAEGWSTFILLAALMYIVVWSVTSAGWINPMPPLPVLAPVPLLLGLVGAKLRGRAIWWHLACFLLGLAAMVWAGVKILPQETWQERLVDLLARVLQWVEVARSGGISTDLLPFALLLAALTWVIGYLTAWFIFKLHWTGVALVPSGVALLVNLSYLPSAYYFHFIAYLLCAMMLVMRLNYFSHQRRWKKEQVRYAGDIIFPFFGDTFVVSILIIILVWLLPSAGTLSFLDNVRERLNQPWENTQEDFNRLFASVTARKPASGQSPGRSLPFRGSVLLGDEVIFTIKSPVPSYWRAQSFDVYTGQGWLSSETVSRSIEAKPSEAPPKEYLSTKEIAQKVEVVSPSKTLYMAGHPIEVSIPAMAETIKEPAYLIDLEGASTDSVLPEDLRLLATRLRSVQSQGAPSSEVLKTLPADVRGYNVVSKEQKIVSLTVSRNNPYPPDTVGLRSSETLKKGKSYEIVSRISTASPDALRSASTSYPGSVKDRYMSLPSELPQRVRRLTQRLTGSLNNPFDKAIAIENYLRGLNYSLTVEPPPPNRDGVDYFLFTSKTGYCDYYASAMAVMLRSIGIPARVSSGYSTGTYDSATGAYVVQALNSHSWPEVYFPDYGWVRFEPTPALPLPEYGSASSFEDELARGLLGDPMLEDYYYEEDYLQWFDAPGVGTMATTRVWWRQHGPVAGSILGIAAIALAFGVWFIWVRGLTGLPYAVQVYERMCRLAGLARLRHLPNQTPGEYSQRLTHALPGYASDIRRISRSYESTLFGRQELGSLVHDHLRHSWRRLRPALIKRIWPWR